MKKLLGLSIIIAFFLSACSIDKLDISLTKINNTNQLLMVHSFNSFAAQITEYDTVKLFVSQFEEAILTPTDNEFDWGSMLSISFYNNEEVLRSVIMDKNNLIRLLGEDQSYSLSNTTLYEDLYTLYKKMLLKKGFPKL